MRLHLFFSFKFLKLCHQVIYKIFTIYLYIFNFSLNLSLSLLQIFLQFKKIFHMILGIFHSDSPIASWSFKSVSLILQVSVHFLKFSMLFISSFILLVVLLQCFNAIPALLSLQAGVCVAKALFSPGYFLFSDLLFLFPFLCTFWLFYY